MCDLERRRVVCLLPDRETGTAEAWLADRPQITVVARDRSGNYALAAARALSQAVQVADRWHLMENASQAFAAAVRQSMQAIRQVLGTSTLDPALLTAAERLQYKGYLRRGDTNAAVLEQARTGMTIKQIVRHTGHSRGLVRRILRGQRSDVFRTRESPIELHLPWLDMQWAAGARNNAALWRQLKLQGFRVGEWATRRRGADTLALDRLQRVPSACTLVRLLTSARDSLSRSQTVCDRGHRGRGADAGGGARDHRSLPHHDPQASLRLSGSLDRQDQDQPGEFVNGIGNDRSAVLSAISSSWSSGQVEGQITRLKLVKRQMYGRAKLDLLEARLVPAP